MAGDRPKRQSVRCDESGMNAVQIFRILRVFSIPQMYLLASRMGLHLHESKPESHSRVKTKVNLPRLEYEVVRSKFARVVFGS